MRIEAQARALEGFYSMHDSHPVLLFYKYVPIADPSALAESHRTLCAGLGIKGRILVATEGINGTVAGPEPGIAAYVNHLRGDARFADMDIKTSPGDASTFPKLSVKVRPEIVALGAGAALVADTHNQISAAEWKRMLEEDPEAVLVDVRNRYESDAGRFEGAIPCDIGHFRELPAFLDQLHAYRHKKVLMYCTGGVRCEKASALFRQNGFERVYQLHGGIVTYQKEFGNEHWLGECFVFDKRMTVPVPKNMSPFGQCKHSGRTTHRFVNCLHDPCHVLFLLAEETEIERPETRLCPDCLAAGLTPETADYVGSPARQNSPTTPHAAIPA